MKFAYPRKGCVVFLGVDFTLNIDKMIKKLYNKLINCFFKTDIFDMRINNAENQGAL